MGAAARWASHGISGIGLGLRPQHYVEVLAAEHDIGWFEAVSDNYMGAGGVPLAQLDRVRERYPLVLHGVGLSLGAVDPLDQAYLKKLKTLRQRYAPAWISDHLCFTHSRGRYSHDLLPLPYTPEALDHCAERITQVQDALGERILVENLSSYLSYRCSQMSEWEFLAAVARQADCALLLDINNIAVSAHNHGFDPQSYLDAIPPERVRQMHLAGYMEAGDQRLDTHGRAVQDDVWKLYAQALRRFGPVPTSIEWDADIPPFAGLLAEAARARVILDAAG